MGGEDGDQLVIELPGGGSVGYAVFGDPDGVPCFAFHGTSSSRLVPGWMFPPGLLTAAGVRMIGVDRPGYGLSRAPRADLRTMVPDRAHSGFSSQPAWRASRQDR